MKKTLHVISFDVPFPANYGGVIDIYFKLKWLNKLGVNIILHCFKYGREERTELNEICSKVYYYNRSKYVNPFIGDMPYIVKTRNNENLLDNLLLDKHPILFEGIHSTFFLNHPKLKSRYKMVRTHNIEHEYYKNLELVESNYFKKYFFRTESDNLKLYEKKLKHAQCLLTISKNDYEHYKSKGFITKLVSAFHGNDQVKINAGIGKFILYHGNLSVGENNFAALHLVNNVFKHLQYPIIIAGNNPSKELKKVCSFYKHISLREDWDNNTINKAISEAQVNVLFTFQGTGIKLKLLNALYTGRHCIVNNKMIENTGLEALCHLSENDEICIKQINQLWEKDFINDDIKLREKLLNEKGFSNSYNAKIIVDLI